MVRALVREAQGTRENIAQAPVEGPGQVPPTETGKCLTRHLQVESKPEKMGGWPERRVNKGQHWERERIVRFMNIALRDGVEPDKQMAG